MQKLATFSLVLVMALMTLSIAEEKVEKKKKVKKPKPALQELSLVGKLIKNEQPEPAQPVEGEKKKKVKKVQPFSLELEDGNVVVIPKNSTKKNKVDLEPLAGKKITLKFSGLQKTKKDKTTYMIKIIVSADEVTEGAAAE